MADGMSHSEQIDFSVRKERRKIEVTPELESRINELFRRADLKQFVVEEIMGKSKEIQLTAAGDEEAIIRYYQRNWYFVKNIGPIIDRNISKVGPGTFRQTPYGNDLVLANLRFFVTENRKRAAMEGKHSDVWFRDAVLRGVDMSNEALAKAETPEIIELTNFMNSDDIFQNSCGYFMTELIAWGVADAQNRGDGFGPTHWNAIHDPEGTPGSAELMGLDLSLLEDDASLDHATMDLYYILGLCKGPDDIERAIQLMKHTAVLFARANSVSEIKSETIH